MGINDILGNYCTCEEGRECITCNVGRQIVGVVIERLEKIDQLYNMPDTTKGDIELHQLIKELKDEK